MKELIQLKKVIADAEEKGLDINKLLVESDAVCYLEENPEGEEELGTGEEEQN